MEMSKSYPSTHLKKIKDNEIDTCSSYSSFPLEFEATLYLDSASTIEHFQAQLQLFFHLWFDLLRLPKASKGLSSAFKAHSADREAC
ncbi:Bcl-2-Associated Transcription Factor 1 [Manis pentadactyla]|nr:Bcl-2-Associated Transcription Factor 1 [Manis pentadactyla]